MQEIAREGDGDARPLLPVVLATALIALALRGLFFLQLSKTPFGRTPFLDAAYYESWASSIAAGDWLAGDQPFFVEPGYLYLVAAMKALGQGLTGVRALQALLGAGTAGLSALIAGRLAGRGPAIAAGMLVALYGPLVHMEGLLLKTTCEVFAATLALALATAPRLRPVAVGVASGAALLFKSNFAVVIPLLVLWAALRGRSRGAGPGASWRAPALLVLGLLPFLMAVGVRNYAVSGEALVMPWSSGINFYIGNGPEADGVDPTLPFVQAGPTREGEAGKREAERRAGRPLSHAESSDFWWRETRQYMLAHPARAAKLMLDKTRLFLHHYEFTDNVSFYFVRERAPALKLAFVGYWLALPLGLCGIFVALLRRTPEELLLSAYLVVQAVGVIAFHVLERYRLALVPVGIALGCAAIAHAAAALRAPGPVRSRGLPAALAGAGLSLGLVLSIGLPPPLGAEGQSMAGQHRLLARHAMQDRDYALAAREYRAAIAANPRIQSFHFGLALSLQALGDEAGARAAIDAGMQLDPLRGPLNLGLLFARDHPEIAARACLRSAQQGHRPGAAYHCAAEALLRLSRPAEAEAALVAGVNAAPRMRALWTLLIAAREAQGDAAGAERARANLALLDERNAVGAE